MQKQEPKIIAGDLSNEELLQWMQGKIGAAQQLKEALFFKEHDEKALKETDERIEALTNHAAIEVLRQEELADDQATDEFDSSPDLLLVSSEILKVVKVELERQHVQPSVENIRCVLALIDGSLPAFAF